jgi:hypothetical protein
MQNKWLLTCCCCLTAIVIGIACRIEYLNIKSQFFLPRNHVATINWHIPELEVVLERLDDQIYERRQNSAFAEAIENGSDVLAEVSFGAPYSESEQKTLDSMKKLHATHTNLQWWVGSFGIAQYFLAPLALIIAVFCAVGLSGWGSKSTAVLCACLSCVSILRMLALNYWNA